VKSGHAFLDISDAELLNIPSCIQATDVKLFFFNELPVLTFSFIHIVLISIIQWVRCQHTMLLAFSNMKSG